MVCDDEESKAEDALSETDGYGPVDACATESKCDDKPEEGDDDDDDDDDDDAK
jgi:hypothetical protein